MHFALGRRRALKSDKGISADGHSQDPSTELLKAFYGGCIFAYVEQIKYFIQLQEKITKEQNMDAQFYC